MCGRRGAPKTGSIATDEMGRRSETAGDAYFKHAHHRLLQQCTGAIQAKIHVEAPWRRIKLGPEQTIHMPLGQPRLSSDLGTRSEEHTSELKTLMRISYALLRLHKNTQ